jgi:NAD(P)H-dependent FMN reductase
MKPRIAVIIGSTRDVRFGEKAARWVLDHAQKRSDLDFELLDIRDFNLPFFNELTNNHWSPSKDPNAIAWQKKLATFDGFIFVTAEYNRSIPASLKNAIDHAYDEWVKKPGAIVSYGAVGGTRAAEHLRTVQIELQQVPIRQGVHIAGSDFMQVTAHGENKPMSSLDAAFQSRLNDLFDNLSWWTYVTRDARRIDAEKQELLTA